MTKTRRRPPLPATHPTRPPRVLSEAERQIQAEAAEHHTAALDYYRDVMADLAALGFVSTPTPSRLTYTPAPASPPVTHTLPDPINTSPAAAPLPASAPRSIKVRSSDKTTLYTVTEHPDDKSLMCNCPAGQNHRMCRHVKESRSYFNGHL